MSLAATPAGAGRRASMHDFSAQTMAILEVESLPELDRTHEQPCKVQMIRETANRVEFDVESPGVRLLVVFDAWAPGWSVRVDSRAARLVRANGMFRAVLVPEGNSRVEFAYVPPGLVTGVALSAVSTAGLLCRIFSMRARASGGIDGPTRLRRLRTIRKIATSPSNAGPDPSIGYEPFLSARLFRRSARRSCRRFFHFSHGSFGIRSMIRCANFCQGFTSAGSRLHIG